MLKFAHWLGYIPAAVGAFSLAQQNKVVQNGLPTGLPSYHKPMRRLEQPESFFDWCTRTLFHYADYYDENSCQEAYEAGQQSVLRLYGMKHMTKDGDGFA